MMRFLNPKCPRGKIFNPSLALRIGIVLLATAIPVSAQPKITLPTPKNGTCDALIPVMAQDARVVAVSDVHGMLAFGHWHTYSEAHVSLVKLDAKGTPAAFATHIKLPKPAGLVKNKNYVTGVAFHPKLPILYAWQDIDSHYTNPVPPATPPEVKQFDHLCVINIAKEVPEVLVSLCRGEEFIFGQAGGALAVDPTGSFLYVPNLREIKNAGSLRFGRYPLDADGLPRVAESKDALPARIKKLTDDNAALKFSPPQMTPIEYVHLFNVNAHGSGHTFVPLGKDVVLSSGHQGLMAWRPEEKHTQLHGLPLKHAGHTQFVVHPTLPAIFSTASYNNPGLDSFFRAEQSEGHLTTLPKQYFIPESTLWGPPAILAKQNKLAVGGGGYVYLVDLDDKGFPTGTPIRVQVNATPVRAMIQSEKHERIYVAVEVSK